MWRRSKASLFSAGGPRMPWHRSLSHWNPDGWHHLAVTAHDAEEHGAVLELPVPAPPAAEEQDLLQGRVGVVEEGVIADGLLAAAAQAAANDAIGLAGGILDDSVGPVAMLAVVRVGEEVALSTELDGGVDGGDGPHQVLQDPVLCHDLLPVEDASGGRSGAAFLP